MNHGDISTTALGLLLPFLGTTLGAAMVFILKHDLKPWVQKALLGFAAGVMIAASVWSLLQPPSTWQRLPGESPGSLPL